MKKQPQIEWNEELKTATCIIEVDGKIYYGTATCHPHDYDMCSQKTGIEIAMKRASIQAYQHYRDCLKERLAALNQFYYSINMSKHHNPKSYESKMLWRQINLIKTDLDTTKEIIVELKKELKTYIDEKDIFYKKIRVNRHIDGVKNVVADKKD